MHKEDTLVLNFAGAMFVFCLVYFLNFSSPRYFPLEGVWRRDAVPDLPAMGWYARFAWSLLAAGSTALLGVFAWPRLLRALSIPHQDRLRLLAVIGCLLMYAIAVYSVIHHEIQTRF